MGEDTNVTVMGDFVDPKDTEKDQNMKGIIVDSVSGVCGIMHRDIDFPQALSTNMDFISGMVRTGSDIIILLDMQFFR